MLKYKTKSHQIDIEERIINGETDEWVKFKSDVGKERKIGPMHRYHDSEKDALIHLLMREQKDAKKYQEMKDQCIKNIKTLRERLSAI